MSTKNGFLLLEIMIALTLFATVSIVVAHYYCRTVSLQGQSRMYCQATSLARNFFESMIRNQSVALPLPNHIDQFTLTWKIAGADIPNLNTVELNVSWKSSEGVIQSVSFSSAFFIGNKLGEIEL